MVRHHRPTSIPDATTNMWPSPSARATRFLRLLIPGMRTIVGLCEFDLRTSGVRSWDDDPRRPVRFALRAPGRGVAARLGIRIRARHALGVRRLGAMRATNPLGRIPSLVLDDGEVLIDSAAISTGSTRPSGPSAHRCRSRGPSGGVLRLVALTGAIDKVGAAAYERLIRPAALRWPGGILRCRTQGGRHRRARGRAVVGWQNPRPGRDHHRLHAPLRHHGRPRALQPGCHPTLEALSARSRRREFEATWPAEYAVPRNP